MNPPIEYELRARVRATKDLWSNHATSGTPDIPKGSVGTIDSRKTNYGSPYYYSVRWDHLNKAGDIWHRAPDLESEHIKEKPDSKRGPFSVGDIVRHEDVELPGLLIGIETYGGLPLLIVQTGDRTLHNWYAEKCTLVEVCDGRLLPLDLTAMTPEKAFEHIKVGQKVRVVGSVVSDSGIGIILEKSGKSTILGKYVDTSAEFCLNANAVIILEQPKEVTIPKGTTIKVNGLFRDGPNKNGDDFSKAKVSPKPNNPHGLTIADIYDPDECVQTEEDAAKYKDLVEHAKGSIPSFIKAHNGDIDAAIKYVLHSLFAKKISWGDQAALEQNMFLPKALNPGHVKRKSRIQIKCDYPEYID